MPRKHKTSHQGTIPLHEWRTLISATKNEYWKKFIDNSNCPTIQEKKDWFTNRNKALFYSTIAAPRKDLFLDVGAGSGIITAELSRSFKKGVALDYGRETTRFMKTRFEQDHVCNVGVVRADGLSMPFNSNMFDLIIVNGVLEWVAYFTHGRNCRKFQTDFLAECARCLKEEGVLAIAIENRWYLGYFFGESPHGEPPFVAVLPRPLARIIHYIICKRDYRTYVYSYFGYKKLLNRAGFKNIDICLAYPNYYSPNSVLPISAKSEHTLFDRKQGQFKGKRSIVERILFFLRVYRFFETAFFISAINRKNNTTS